MIAYHEARAEAGVGRGLALLLAQSVGDCLGPRTAEEAVMEGLKAAMAI